MSGGNGSKPPRSLICDPHEYWRGCPTTRELAEERHDARQREYEAKERSEQIMRELVGLGKSMQELFTEQRDMLLGEIHSLSKQVKRLFAEQRRLARRLKADTETTC